MLKAYQPKRWACLPLPAVRHEAGLREEGRVMTVSKNFGQGLRTFAADIGQGLFEITHNGFAMLGLAVMFAAVTLSARPDIRELGETQLRSWLQARQIPLAGAIAEATAAAEPQTDASDRATASDPKDLPKQQASVAFWLSKKYRVAPEPLSALVAEAYDIGGRTKLDPTLILAIMAVESGFNPFAQSAVGAQGLMQVMTKIHGDKYETFGGHLAAFDPLTNLRVGVKVLQECIARAGSLEGGLRFYVGAANLEGDSGYAGKVMAEHARIQSVASGRPVPLPAASVVPAALSSPTVQPVASDRVASLSGS